MTKANWLLYGANGYTGELIAREAGRRSQTPILAGRSAAAISKLAKELHAETCTFALDDIARIVPQLAGARLVLNCAGPFSATAFPFMEACLRAGVHYLDITGEIDVIEAASARSERARQAGIALLPAVGFDVVPSDCLAGLLAERLPGATHLQLAFRGAGYLSPGTTKTWLEGLPKGGRVRIDGRITRVPLAYKSREIPFADGSRQAVTIPWGDVATAYYSSGIGNIEVYTTVAPEQLRLLRRYGWLLPLLRWGPLLRFFQRRVERTVRGPTAGDRASNQVSMWGRVENRAGRGVEATLITPNAYDLTVLTALAAVERVLSGGVAPGFHTPAQAFGREFILSMPGTELQYLPANGPQR